MICVALQTLAMPQVIIQSIHFTAQFHRLRSYRIRNCTEIAQTQSRGRTLFKGFTCFYKLFGKSVFSCLKVNWRMLFWSIGRPSCALIVKLYTILHNDTMPQTLPGMPSDQTPWPSTKSAKETSSPVGPPEPLYLLPYANTSFSSISS